LEETDTAPSSGDANTLWVPYFEPDGPDSSAYSGYTSYIPDGVTGNQEARLRRSAKYVGSTKTDPNKDCNLQKILPLTSSKVTLMGNVGGMVATGNTHIALGAGWGWRVLSPTAPYTEGSSYGGSQWTKAMVLMTDGLNTTPSNFTWHRSNYTAYNYLIRNQLGTTVGATADLEQDNRTALVCSRIKSAGIRLYTILLEEQSSRAKDLMEECASEDPSAEASKKCNGNKDKLCFESPSAAQLKSVFQTIANDLSNLRLSK
jgi:hypothetical protein